VSKTAVQWTLVLFKLLAASGVALLGFAGISEFIGLKVTGLKVTGQIGEGLSGAQVARSGGQFVALQQRQFFGQSATPSKAIKRIYYISIIVAMVMIAAAGLCAVLTVSKPASIMAAARNLTSGSPISLELLMYGLAVAVGLVYFFVKRSESRIASIVGIITVLVAVAVGYSTGYSHQAMPGTPAWHTIAIPLSFMLSALLLGGLLFQTIVMIVSKDSVATTISWVLVGVAAANTLALAAYGLIVQMADIAVYYWLLAVVVGGVGAAAYALLMARKASLAWAGLAALAALVGALTIRVYVWLTVGSGLLI
jgi:formate-dependent nitrite reductase membrane component NrfD